MKKSTWKSLIKYAAAFFCCGAVTLLYLSQHNFAAISRQEQYRILSDAFLIPGLLLIMFAFLVTLSNGGALDGISYIASRAIYALIPGSRKDIVRFYDYVERKRQNPIRGYAFLFIVGGCFLTVAIVFYILFYRIYLP